MTARYSPRGALGERFTCSPRPRIAAIRAPASGTPTTASPHARRYARRHRTCVAMGPRPRSTPQGACFMTSPDVTRTSVAREVKLYLALPSPSSSRRALPDPIPSPSSVPRRTRSGPADATLGSPGPCPRTARARRNLTTSAGHDHRSEPRTSRATAGAPGRFGWRSGRHHASAVAESLIHASPTLLSRNAIQPVAGARGRRPEPRAPCRGL